MNGRIISERTTAGLAAAKARGRTDGRPTVMTPERIAIAKRMREEKATWDSIATPLQAGSASIRRALDSDRTSQLQQAGWGRATLAGGYAPTMSNPARRLMEIYTTWGSA